MQNKQIRAMHISSNSKESCFSNATATKSSKNLVYKTLQLSLFTLAFALVTNRNHIKLEPKQNLFLFKILSNCSDIYHYLQNVLI